MSRGAAAAGAIHLAELWIHPVKSLAGVRLQRARLTPTGLDLDRAFALVDAAGVVLTAKRRPELLRLRTELAGDELLLVAPGGEALRIPLDLRGTVLPRLRIHRREIDAERIVVDGLEPWLARHVGPGCALVRADGALFDAQALSVHGRASAAALASTVVRGEDARRYRSNLVLAGCAARAEDAWRAIEVGGIALRALATIGRCSMITVDPERGDRGDEPLRALAHAGDSPRLGCYFAAETSGEVAVGALVVPTPAA